MLIDRVETGLAQIDEMGDVIPASDYLPPHKMVSFVPYDGIVPLYDDGRDDPWTEEEVAKAFEENDVPYDEVIGIDANDSRADGDRLAFVKFRKKHQLAND